MSKTISQLLNEVKPDPWRNETGFSVDVADANKRLFDEKANSSDRAEALSGWLRKYQPCLFGRIAAKAGFLNYCILTEADLEAPDDSIREKIQAARSDWTRDGFEGKKNGFIILAISERLACALPNETIKQLALRLCSLYLLTEIKLDEIYHDEIWLEKPGSRHTTWSWNAGVNYFSAQGDKRWWQDHRIPGGVAFSINSVGHMVKSGILAKAMLQLEAALGGPTEGWAGSRVDTLGKALELAMRTISMASDGPSGKATELLALPKHLAHPTGASPPVALPQFMLDKNFREYLGHYHTDVTVPSEYFRPDIERPAGLDDHLLDFSYLFDRSVENPDFITMGEGRRIREDEPRVASAMPSLTRTRLSKTIAREMRIDESKRLQRALSR
jgi:hypothetical protein